VPAGALRGLRNHLGASRLLALLECCQSINPLRSLCVSFQPAIIPGLDSTR
jgi:hypothetical protein